MIVDVLSPPHLEQQRVGLELACATHCREFADFKEPDTEPIIKVIDLYYIIYIKTFISAFIYFLYRLSSYNVFVQCD